MAFSLAMKVAIESGDVRGIETALATGDDINARSSDGQSASRPPIWRLRRPIAGITPVMLAVYHDTRRNNQTKVLRYLLERGADPNVTTSNGETPLQVAVILLPCDDLTEHDYENTFSFESLVEIMQLLIAHGADVNAVDRKGRTALHYACHEGEIDLIRLLLRHGAGLPNSAIAVCAHACELNSASAHYQACLDLVRCVRSAGSWQRYVREPSANLKGLRYLCLAGRATAPPSLARLFGRPPVRSPKGAATRSRRRENSIARTPLPEEVFAHVLGFWDPRRDERPPRPS